MAKTNPKTDFNRLNDLAASMTQNKPAGAAHSNPILQANSGSFNRDTSADQVRHIQRDQEIAANHAQLMSEIGRPNNA